jgi:hypothetical protein
MAFLSPLVLSANLDDDDRHRSGDVQLQVLLLLIAALRMLDLWCLLVLRQLAQQPWITLAWLQPLLLASTHELYA